MTDKFYLTKKLPPYIFAAINEVKAEAVKKGIDLIDFGMGNPDSAPPEHVIKYLNKLTQQPSLYGYSTVGGIENLRKAICAYYKRVFSVNLDYKTESLVTIGSKEGISSLATAISDEKSHICIASPSYPIHTFAFTIARSNTYHINAVSAEGFLQSFKEHVAKNKNKVKAVIVNYPSNPTAEIVDLAFYKDLVAFCKKNKIFIISDIAYAELYFDPKNKPPSILQVKGAKDIAIEFYSTSKSYSMAGCRVGFALGNKDLISALFKIKCYLDYGSFEPLQLAAVEALSTKSDDYLDSLRKLYDDRGHYFIKKAQEILDWKIPKSKASMFLWTKLPQKFRHMSSYDFCQKLIIRTGVVFCPGSSFGENGEGYIRISLIHNNEKVDQALNKVAELMDDQI